MGLFFHRQQKPGDSPHTGIDRPGVNPAPTGPDRFSSDRLTIGGTDGFTLPQNPVPDTKAARKVNSPKAKAKALKKVKPLAINPFSTEGDSFEHRFMSEQGLHYKVAQVAEQGHPSGYNLPYNKTNKEVVDEYTKTGKITTNPGWDTPNPVRKPQL